RVIGLDCDVTNANLAKRIEALALKMLGPTICRIGRAPKFLLPYRVADFLTTAAVTLTKGDPNTGEKHVVEIRGALQQWVAAGTHPGTGKPYRYERGDLATVGYSGLTGVT